MKKQFLANFLLLSLLLLPLMASAEVKVRHEIDLETPGTTKTLVLPTNALNSKVISLGSAVDPESGMQVEGYAIVHYAKGQDHNAKPEGVGGGKDKNNPSNDSGCYELMAKGTKWKNVEPWVINPSNSEGLDASFLLNNMKHNIDKWEDAADRKPGDGKIVDILGEGSISYNNVLPDLYSLDGVNAVVFGDISSAGAIGVTMVWGIFDGPPKDRMLVEWDQVYDEVDYDWSSGGEAGKMDFENIATHELGHSLGMADLYDYSCQEETMFGYAANGETYKRDLSSGDIAGISSLY